jgi:phosphate transport system substrate-binding protein
VCALLACALVACARARTPTAAPSGNAPEAFQVAGSTAAEPLLDLLWPAFEKRHPEVPIAAEEGLKQAPNTSQALDLISAGTTPLAAVAGLEASCSAPDDLWSAPVAVDAIAVIVHRDNPVRSLTRVELYQVFTGRTWHWSVLDAKVGADAHAYAAGTDRVHDEITVVSRERSCGTRAAFVDQALRPRPDLEPAPVTTMAVLQMSSADVVTYVAEHPGAIGYVALAAIDAQAGVRAIAVEDIAPGPEQVADGSYPFSLPLYLVAQEEPTGAARTFLDFCLSAEGQRLVAQRYVPVK